MWKTTMLVLSILITKISHFLIRLFTRNPGLTWPGHLVLTLFPDILRHPAFSLSKGYIFVSGTNGKTTTAKLITHILKAQNTKVVTNKSGANLLNGIVTELLLDKSIFGTSHADIGVIEVDEFNLTLLLKYIEPRVLVLLNLSRDQLDRFGETDTILERWKESVAHLKLNTTLVLDSTQDVFKEFTTLFRGTILYFNNSLEKNLTYPLKGDFNVKNINAATTVVTSLGIKKTKCFTALLSFDAAYGRGEKLFYKNTFYTLFLAKNPASFNNNLDILAQSDFLDTATCLFVLNDAIPDGRDVSWIYDIDATKIKTALVNKNIFISGTRAFELALRFKYACVNVVIENVDCNLKNVLAKITALKVKEVVVFPNYSAMLQSRKILTGKKIL